ncbi:MAG TPA: D-glycero-beta-D-manno-heptose-7-phosphate kinase [Chthonomonadaceae bacterium]|nr:D-glycero-beta-D-manno-heptose-7-phosphate kinase [Chthonomonadaceae bacterium]
MRLEYYQRLVHSFADRRILVLGDLMLDEYLLGRATRISPESPVMVVEVDKERCVPGGAANVVNNLLALGARVAIIGVIGQDLAGETLRADLAARGADVTGIVIDPSRPTTRKTRVVAHSQQVLRVDREQTHPISPSVAHCLIEHLRREVSEAEAVVVSDYNKGVLTAQVARAAVQIAREAGRILTSNPKPPNVRTLAGAKLVSLNQVEAQTTADDPRFADEDGLDEAGAALIRQLHVETLVVTRGPKGLSIWHADGSIRHIPAHPVEVYDVAGAGDTVISAITLGLAAGASVEEAAEVANHAAACVVRKVGVATVTPEELLADWRL